MCTETPRAQRRPSRKYIIATHHEGTRVEQHKQNNTDESLERKKRKEHTLRNPKMFNDELPEDEMDPCCQKERENERRKFAVSKELRKTDRSNVRNDLRKTVFTMDGNGKCGCCSKPSVDYALLAQLKQKLDIRSSSSVINQERTDIRNNEDDDDDDDDEDGTFAELLNTLTPADEERLQQIELSVMKQEKAGFAVHIEDSIGHMETMIAQRRSIVCHLYDPTSTVSAIIDYALETLSKKYLGTTFRRMELSANVQTFRSKWRMEDHGNCWQPCLAVYTDGQLTASTTNMELFCNRGNNNMQEIVVCPTVHDEDDVLECIRLCVSELEKYLNHARVLEPDLPYNTGATGFRLLGGVDVDGSDDEEEHTSYCDMEGCDRNFPHEHVTGQGGGTLTGAASNDKGADALAKDWYSKI